MLDLDISFDAIEAAPSLQPPPSGNYKVTIAAAYYKSEKEDAQPKIRLEYKLTEVVKVQNPDEEAFVQVGQTWSDFLSLSSVIREGGKLAPIQMTKAHLLPILHSYGITGVNDLLAVVRHESGAQFAIKVSRRMDKTTGEERVDTAVLGVAP